MVIDHRQRNAGQLLSQYLEARAPSENTWTSEQVLTHTEKYRFPWAGLSHQSQLAAIVLYNQFTDLTEIQYLETASQLRGQGFMKNLLGEFIRSQGERSIWLDVHEGNHSARALYNRFGFKQTGLRKGYYRDGGSCFMLSLDHAVAGGKNC